MSRTVKRPARDRTVRGALVTAIVLGASVCGNPNRPSGPSIDGVYTLRISTTCAALPESARVRTYTATISGSPRATVTLAGATFWQHPDQGLANRMTATVTGATIAFSLGPGSGFGVVEEVEPGVFYEASGSASTTASGWVPRRDITATLRGTVRLGQNLRNSTAHALCGAQGNEMQLSFTSGATGATHVGVSPSVATVSVTAPPSIAPNATAQLEVSARMSDGSTRLLTDGVSWRTSNSFTVQVSSTGLARAIRIGEANLTLTVTRPHLGTLTTQHEVVVVPDGTFRVIGQVTEIDAPSPVPGARVDVLAASDVIVATTQTDGGGRYRLYGVPPDATLRITRDGYSPIEERQELTAHTTKNFALRLLAPRPDLAGTYAMAIAVGACPGSRPLPDDLRQRTYTAAVEQNGAELTVRLSGATFAVDSGGHGNRFSGRVEPSGATFTLGSGWYGYYSYYFVTYPDLSERVSNGGVLAVSGTATTTFAPNGLSGTLNGAWELHGSRFPSYDFLSGCDGRTPHSITFTRIN